MDSSLNTKISKEKKATIEWVEKPVGEKAYDRRFIYFEGKTIDGTYFIRETRQWWKPFECFGFGLENVVLYIFKRIVSKIELNQSSYAAAKRFSALSAKCRDHAGKCFTSEKEFLRRFSTPNPYCVEPYGTVLQWIRKHLLYT